MGIGRYPAIMQVTLIKVGTRCMQTAGASIFISFVVSLLWVRLGLALRAVRRRLVVVIVLVVVLVEQRQLVRPFSRSNVSANRAGSGTWFLLAQADTVIWLASWIRAGKNLSDEQLGDADGSPRSDPPDL